MSKKHEYSDIVQLIDELAFGKTNDAVKLVFMDPEDSKKIEKLDLRMVQEIKRGSSGGLEIKFIDRIKLLEFLAGCLKPPESEAGTQAQSFFEAMDKAAARLPESEQ